MLRIYSSIELNEKTSQWNGVGEILQSLVTLVNL